MKRSVMTTMALVGLVGLTTSVEAATIQATPKERTPISQNQPYSPEKENTGHHYTQKAILEERDYIPKLKETKF